MSDDFNTEVNSLVSQQLVIAEGVITKRNERKLTNLVAEIAALGVELQTVTEVSWGLFEAKLKINQYQIQNSREYEDLVRRKEQLQAEANGLRGDLEGPSAEQTENS